MKRLMLFAVLAVAASANLTAAMLDMAGDRNRLRIVLYDTRWICSAVGGICR